MNRRLPFICMAIMLLCTAGTAVTGCGSGAGNGTVSTQFSARPTPEAAVPSSPPDDPARPAARLADLSRGASWDYLTFPGAFDGGTANLDLLPTGYTSIALVPAGSPLTVRAGCAATDTNIPGALVRLCMKGGALPYRYDGTYRQDAATRNLYLLRLPTGERLDTPARVLPGTWESGAEINSQFVIGGRTRAEYTLTIDTPEIIDTRVGKKAVWQTTIRTHWFGPRGMEHILTSRQCFEPTSGAYLQATFRDLKMILDDLTLIEILDDEIISSYKINP